MLRLLKHSWWVGLLAAGSQAAFAFSLGGPPNEPYQAPVIGYNLPGDLNAPKNLGEEYRRNTPVLYYTCDANFWNYFGSNGVAAIDEAFQVFNNLTNVSSYSSQLTEFPYQTLRKNLKAEALYLIDIKTITMQLITEQLGLTEPVRYTWGLHDRFLSPGTTCPFGENYLIIKRNFDPVFGTSPDQLKPTSYVNGTLYSYVIDEFCTGPNPLAIALPFAVDPTAESAAVAELYGFGFAQSLLSPYGVFFNGLTRDDVGGLRYLLRANNVNIESAGPDSLAHITNNTPTLLVSSNLALLASQALTNDAPTLQGLYPNLTILASSNYFANVYITNFSAYFTNFPWDPVGTPAHIAYVTNVTPTVVTLYQHTFGNVLQLVPNGHGGWTTVPLAKAPAPNSRIWVSIQTDTVGTTNQPWLPVGTTTIVTNTVTQTFLTNGVTGDYVILPTNACEVAILASQLTNVVASTNIILTATNLIANTNIANTLLGLTQSLVTYFTNHAFVVLPVSCTASNVAAYGGVEKITFIRRDFDSLFGRFFFPITNEYVLHTVTNFTVYPQRVSRIVTRPDFLITAADLTAGPEQIPASPAVARAISFNTNSENFLLAGPGTIESGTIQTSVGPLPITQFTYNNVGPIYYNFGLVDTNAFLDELSQIPIMIWGSFDGSTNVPTLYPNDVSISALENQMLIQITPQYLPDGLVGASYSASLQTAASTPNWTGPFTWSLAPGSPALPPGLGITTAGFGAGLISGTPVQDGFFDFIIRVTDSQGRTVDRSYSIRIVPAS